MKQPIEFEPIPGEFEGHVALTIRPPGTWMPGTYAENILYKVFVGGCGVADAKTLLGAEKLLLKKAMATCEDRARKAERTAAHYRAQGARLQKTGLRRKK